MLRTQPTKGARTRVCASRGLILVTLLLLVFPISASQCPVGDDVRFSPGNSLRVHGMEIPIPKEMSITSFRTTREPFSGQEFDEIRFSGKDQGASVFIWVRSTTTYELADDFDWKLLEGGGEPILTGGLDPVSWTPASFENWRCSECQNHMPLTRMSSGSR